MEKEITMTHTKKEILTAYEELLEELKNQKSEDPKIVKAEKIVHETIINASANTVEGIVNNIAALKLNLSKSLDKVGDDLAKEFKKLTEIQEAKKIEEKNLAETYQLTSETDSLAIMLKVQKDKKEAFENEMKETKEAFTVEMKEARNLFDTEMKEKQEKLKLDIQEKQEALKTEILTKKEKLANEIAEEKAIYEKEKAKFEAENQEYNEQILKDRKREEEDYNYLIKTSRKKEKDIYEDKKEKQEKELAEQKKAFEKEIVEREQAVALHETELKELRKEAAAFPEKLEKTVNEATSRLQEKLEMEYKFQTQLLQKETEGEVKLKNQIIKDLQDKVESLIAQNKILLAKAEKAELDAKEITMKAIETSGTKPMMFERNYKKEESEK